MSTPTSPSRGISGHVTITVLPENSAKFLQLSRPVFDAISSEPKCLYFEIFESAEQKGKFRIVENWAMSIGEFVQVSWIYYLFLFGVHTRGVGGGRGRF